MKLVLGEDYPAGPPKGYFITKIFHPNGIYLPLELHLSPLTPSPVSSTGQICVNTLKKDWTPEVRQSCLLDPLSMFRRPPSSTCSR